MKLFLGALLTLCCISCSRQQMDPPPAIVLYNSGEKVDFPTYTTTTQVFCEKKLVTINAGQLLISFIADSLSNGTYPAGLNWWGNYTDNITLTISHISRNRISANFKGKICSGAIQ